MSICSIDQPPPVQLLDEGDGVARPLTGCAGWVWRWLPVPHQSVLSQPMRQETTGNFWLQPTTRAFLQENDFGFTTRYVEVMHNGSGRRLVATLQSFDFSAPGNVSDAAKGTTSRADVRRRLLVPFKFPVLAIGQLLNSGPYAMESDAQFSPEELAELLASLAATLQEEPGKTYAVIIKDLFVTNNATTQRLLDGGYYALPVDPVMELAIPAAWKSIDDYLVDLSSKYRVRYRRARAKFTGLSCRPLLTDEARQRSRELHELYQLTSEGASYNGVQLSPAYFAWVAAQPGPFQLGEDTNAGARPSSIMGYFDGEQLVGFASAIVNGTVLHAHYLGLRSDYKYSHHLYHNVLYDLLAAGIRVGCTKVDYGRTALEIKSSLGAIPVDYACLVKARNRLVNRLVPLFTPAVYTAPSWQQRNPFRSSP